MPSVTQNITASIQGALGSFHHEAALKFFQDTEVQTLNFDACMSFNELGENLNNGTSQIAVMAIENSIAGSILPNYNILDRYDFQIMAEIYLNISQDIMALEGQSIEDIEEVWSHPMALLQCEKYLSQFQNIKTVEYPDTADAARYIKEHNLKKIAAIAGVEAANIYGLKLLAQDIQSEKNNETRFFVIKKQETVLPFIKKETVNKASLKLVLKHAQGVLAKALKILDQHHLNLTKIQSVPIPRDVWHYAFFIDVVFDDYTNYEATLSALESEDKLVSFKILGVYKNDNP